jgi:hypothetical protein
MDVLQDESTSQYVSEEVSENTFHVGTVYYRQGIDFLTVSLPITPGLFQRWVCYSDDLL